MRTRLMIKVFKIYICSQLFKCNSSNQKQRTCRTKMAADDIFLILGAKDEGWWRQDWFWITLMSRIHNAASNISHNYNIILIPLFHQKQGLSGMISFYQNSFISYTNLITYVVVPCLQENQNSSQNDSEKRLSASEDFNNSQKTLHEHETLPREPISKENSHISLQTDRDNSLDHELAALVKQAKKNRRKAEKKEHAQKYGRNICSNIFHIIIKKVLYEKQYNDVILRLIQKFQMTLTLQQFYSKLYFKQNKLKQYVPFDKIIEFYSGAKNKIKESMKKHAEFCRILRVVSGLYLQQEHITMAFDCQKLKKESKYFHIRQSRKLYSIIRGTYHQDYKS